MRRSVLLTAWLSCAACGTDEALPSEPSGQPDAGSPDADPPDAEPADAGPKIRTVEVRNPFGNTAAENNLMVDGDFEWTSGTGQHGWRATSTTAEVGVSREFGGLCRSGVSCGILENGVALLGLATAPRGKQMLITLYAKPPEPDCGLTTISVISCTSGTVFSVATVPPTTSVPAASGWCQYRATSPAMQEQPCLYVTTFAQAGQRVLIDDATIVAADGTGASPLAPTAPSAELAARILRDVRWMHERQLIGRPPPRDD
jgi:hypothetical protein